MAHTKYIWDTLSDNVLMEKDENGDTQATNTYLPDLYGDMISQRRDGETSYYHFDGQGSTRALTDENEDVTDTYTYTAFGEEVSKTGTTENPYRYVGEKGYYFDGETEDYYVRTRAYAPNIARWMSLGPGFFISGLSGFKFVTNNPFASSDESANENDAAPADYPVDVTNVEGETRDRKCGEEVLVGWDFSLRSKTAFRGWMVQKLDVWARVYEDCSKCPEKRLIDLVALALGNFGEPDKTFYEAWPVFRGERKPWALSEERLRKLPPDAQRDFRKIHAVKHSDASGVETRQGKCAYHVAIGTIRFFDQKDVKDVLDDTIWKEDVTYHVGAFSIDTGQPTKSKVGMPKWWNTHAKGKDDGKRGLAVWFNCCPCANKFVSAYRIPTGKNKE